MSILDQLIHLMLARVEVKPVPQAELDAFLIQNHLQLCEEHYQFLLQYGNSDFLARDYANLTFSYAKIYYLDDELLDDSILPPNCQYLGTDFSSETICIDNYDKKIYTFDYGEKYEKFYYGGLKELLFFCLFKLLYKKNYFNEVKDNIRINNIEQFKQQYLAYEIKDVYIYDRYFFKEGELIICDHEFYSYHLCQGGILDQVITND